MTIDPKGQPALPLVFQAVSLQIGSTKRLNDLDFKLVAGPLTVLLGPNGAGKTLLLKLCHGILAPSNGRIFWQSPGTLAPNRQAMVFQRPVMLRRSVVANIAYPLILRGMSRAHRATRVAAVLTQTGLGALARRAARTLSAGEQQRLAIARAWSIEPEILFLDEPTANLDPTATHAIEDLISEIARGGTKVLLATNDLGQAKRLAGEILFLHRGRLLEQTSAQAFFDGPADPAARAFLRGELPW